MRRAVETSRANPKFYHQVIINDVFKDLQEQKKMDLVNLPQKEWPSGRMYFERRVNDIGDVVLVHNNWLVGIAAKVYRFKEHLMWVSDQDRYYSDPHRKYLTYDNPVTFSRLTKKEETLALHNALAISMLLNRTLILPAAFHCRKLRVCSAAGFLKMDRFHKAVKGLYRESSFLRNPRTPGDLSRSPLVLIQSDFVARKLSITDEVQLFQPHDAAEGATLEELEDWLSPFADCRVLRFHSLYRAFSGFPKNSALDSTFNKQWRGLVM